MAFLSFIGRLLFVSVFILSAYQEFRKHCVWRNLVFSEVQQRFNEFGVDGGPAANALGPKFNVFSKHVRTHTGFKVPNVEMKHLVLGTIIMRGLGSFLFVFGSSLGAYILILHQAVVTPIVYDFYNYDADKIEFAQLFVKFTQGLQLIGALLFYVGTKNSRPRRPTKKAAKTKTN